MVSFEKMEKNEFIDNSHSIFLILATNMKDIAPTGKAYDEDFRCWKQAVGEGLKHPARDIILIKDVDLLIGFFQYYVNNGTFMMEEIQFNKEWQGQNNLFRQVYGYLLSTLPDTIIYVEAYAHKSNIKSQRILKHLGLEIIGENKDGTSYHFRGFYDDLRKWYYKK